MLERFVAFGLSLEVILSGIWNHFCVFEYNVCGKCFHNVYLGIAGCVRPAMIIFENCLARFRIQNKHMLNNFSGSLNCTFSCFIFPCIAAFTPHPFSPTHPRAKHACRCGMFSGIESRHVRSHLRPRTSIAAIFLESRNVRPRTCFVFSIS